LDNGEDSLWKADPDPAFYLNVDPDGQINATIGNDPCLGCAITLEVKILHFSFFFTKLFLLKKESK
jgi:hypothetical protein